MFTASIALLKSDTLLQPASYCLLEGSSYCFSSPAPGKLKLILHLLYSERAATATLYISIWSIFNTTTQTPPCPLKLTFLFPAPNCYRPPLLNGFLQLFLNILKSCDFERCHDCERGLGFSQNSLFSNASFLKHALNHKAQPSTQLQQLFFSSLHVSVKDSGKFSLFRSPLYSHELPKTNESELNVLTVLSQLRKTLCVFNRTLPQTWQLFKQVSDVPHDTISNYLSFWMLSG